MTVVAVLRRGPGWVAGRSLGEQPACEEHRAFVRGLERDGTLEGAGPLCPLDEAPEELVGLLVFAGADADEARRLLAADPARVAGVLAADVAPLVSLTVRGPARGASLWPDRTCPEGTSPWATGLLPTLRS